MALHRLIQRDQVRLMLGGSADRARGMLALRLDLIDEAAEHFRTGPDWVEPENLPLETAWCHQGLAEVAINRGETAEAPQLLPDEITGIACPVLRAACLVASAR